MARAVVYRLLTSFSLVGFCCCCYSLFAIALQLTGLWVFYDNRDDMSVHVRVSFHDKSHHLFLLYLVAAPSRFVLFVCSVLWDLSTTTMMIMVFVCHSLVRVFILVRHIHDYVIVSWCFWFKQKQKQK